MHFFYIDCVSCSCQGARKGKSISVLPESFNQNCIENIKYQKYYWTWKYVNTEYQNSNILI